MAVVDMRNVSLTFPSIFNNVSVKNNQNVNGTGFAEFLSNAVNNTNNLILEADKLSNDFAAGRIDDMDTVLIAAEKAEIAFQYLTAIRSKLLDAYSEIMRMQV